MWKRYFGRHGEERERSFVETMPQETRKRTRKAMLEERCIEYIPQGSTAVRIRQELISGSPHRFGWHATVELMSVIAGEVTIYADGTRYSLAEGDALWIGPNCGHFYHPLRADSRALITEVDPGFLSGWQIPVRPNSAFKVEVSADRPLRKEAANRNNPDEWLPLPDAAGFDPQSVSAELWNRLREVNRHLVNGSALSFRAAEAATALLFIDIEQSRQVLDAASETHVPGDNPIVASALRHVDAHYSGRILLSDIAREAGCSKTYLSTLFKQQTGISVRDHIARLRVRRAVDLIGSTADSLTDIALICGFPDNRSLTSAIKKYCGMTPQEYRILLSGQSCSLPARQAK